MKEKQINPLGQDLEIKYMRLALDQAKKAKSKNEVPIGAVVVDEHGVVIGRGYNRVMATCSQSAHAEMIALTRAGKKRGDWRLDGCWLFVTLEPCMMCMGLARLSRIQGIVYAASSPLFGYGQERLDKDVTIQVYKKDIEMIKGILEEEALLLLRVFFQKRRKKGESGASAARSG